jgi:hypothetical protein
MVGSLSALATAPARSRMMAIAKIELARRKGDAANGAKGEIAREAL